MKRGDIYLVDLEPTMGREQRGKRPVMVVSREDMNKRFPAIICPISGGGVEAREAGVTVSLQGLGMRTDGVVLCHQVCALDIKARKGKKIETASAFVVDEVMSALQDILGDD